MLPSSSTPVNNALLRYYSPAQNSTSYCAPVISNGTLYTQIDISGTQKQDVRYTYHGKNGSRQDMIPGIYLAGRRYNSMQRPLIPFGYFEETGFIGDEKLGEAENAGQILDLYRGSTGCRNDYAGNLSILTHAFVHKNLPIVAIKKKFINHPEDFKYRFDYYYANAGEERTPV
jgi:hypothetical protein